MSIELPFPPAKPWARDELDHIRESYALGHSVAQISTVLGRSKGAVRNKAYELGITTRNDGWAPDEIATIVETYTGDPLRGELNLNELSASLGRPKASICKKAREMGLTNQSRKGPKKPKADQRKYKTDEERSAARSEALRRRHATTPHPMAGKRHAPEVRQKISEKSSAAWAAQTSGQRSNRVHSMLESRLKSQGTLAPPRPHASWKAGWREVGDQRNYYRSRWEANYARYLEWLRVAGEIAAWKHEPETFWFDGIKRGVRSYLPDFRVWENDGSSKLHEVKGWMDARSKTTLRRMAKYHPSETIIVIREKQYNEIARKIGPMIAEWESGGRADRP